MIKDDIEKYGFEVSEKSGKLLVNMGGLTRARVEYDIAKDGYVVKTGELSTLISGGYIMGMSLFGIMNFEQYYVLLFPCAVLLLYLGLLTEIKVTRVRDIVEIYNRKHWDSK